MLPVSIYPNGIALRILRPLALLPKNSSKKNGIGHPHRAPCTNLKKMPKVSGGRLLRLATSAGSSLLPANSAGQPGTAAPAASTDNGSRGALATQGLEIFHGLDYMMVVYGCYRAGTHVLCDFDLLRANAAQVGVGPFANVVMVDDGGKITRRHDAYYMGTDGTRMQAAHVSTAPV